MRVDTELRVCVACCEENRDHSGDMEAWCPAINEATKSESRGGPHIWPRHFLGVGEKRKGGRCRVTGQKVMSD